MRLKPLMSVFMPTRPVLALTALIVSMAAALPIRAQPIQPIVPLDQIVAVVNDDVVLASELTREIRKRLSQMPDAKRPSQSILARQVLERLIIERLQLEQAERNGIKIADERLNRAIASIARQNNMTLAQMRTTLEAEGLEYAAFREQIRDQLTIRQLRQRQVNNQVNVTDQEIEHFLQSEAGQDKENTEYKLAQILIAVPPAAVPAEVAAAKEKADRLVKALREGADFTALAIEHSDGQNALQGGDLGWRAATRVPSVFTHLITRMNPGEVSDPVRSAGGYHILTLMDRRVVGEKHVVTQYKARHILIKPSAVLGAAEIQERLQRIKIRLEGGEDFATLAKANSEDTGSALNGGELDWAVAGDYAPRFANALQNIPTGQISEPFESAFGWHILQVLDRRQVDQTEEVIWDRARKELTTRKVEEETQHWLRRLRDEAYVELRIDVASAR